MLRDFVRGRSLGRVYVAPFDVHLPSGDIVEPDVIFVTTAKLGIVQGWIRGVPDFVVEVLSPDGIERDRIVKRVLYAKNGIREYWLVDARGADIGFGDTNFDLENHDPSAWGGQ